MSFETALGRRGVAWLVAGLLAVHVWMAASVSPRHSVTADEIAHLTAGYTYWTRGDYRFQPENGNLPQRLGALPLLFTGVRFPEPDHAWRISDVWKAGYDFFYTQGNDRVAMLRASRSFMALLGAVAGLGVFLWSRRLWGVGGGLLSLTLWCFCPNALAHAGLVTSDMAATAAFLGAITVCWWAMQRITPGRVLLAGLATGLLALAKFSAPLIAPVVVVLALLRAGFGPRELPVGSRRLEGVGAKLVALVASQMVVVALALAVLWSAYGWRHSIYAHGEKLGEVRNLVGWDILEAEPTTPLKIVWWARDHSVIPEAYAYGFAHSYKFSQNRRSFLNGEYRADGWLGFFPYTTWVKTPPAAWALLAGLVGALVFRGWRSRRGAALASKAGGVAEEVRRRLYLAAPLIIFGYVYACSALPSGLNIGHRHVLPLYPLLYILLGAAWPLVAGAHRLARIAIVVLVAGVAAESLASRPSYLSYFNHLDGGPREAYRHVVDSSLDWGQDLPSLRDWLEPLPKETRVYVSYFGSADPLGEGVRGIRIADDDFDWHPRVFPAELRPGVYCISATMLQQVYSRARGPWDGIHRARLAELEAKFASAATGGPALSRTEAIQLEHYRFAELCARLRTREPDARVASSILVYVVGAEELAAARASREAGR